MIGEVLNAALIRRSADHGGVFDMERRREGAIQNQRAGLRWRAGRRDQENDQGKNESGAAVRSHG
jgi:hypothetical protein